MTAAQPIADLKRRSGAGNVADSMADPIPPTSTKWLARAIFGVVLMVHGWLMSVNLDNPGLAGQEFRQAQTAISCFFTQRDGYLLNYPTPVLGKPWSAPMEFPLYQWAVAAWANSTGAPIHTSGRMVGILCFYASLPALFLLLRRLRLPEHQAWLGLAFVVASPIYIFYTRTVMIESMAVAFVAWHLLFVTDVIAGTRRLPLTLPLAWLTGAGAILVKITTWAGWILAAIAFTLYLLVQAWRAGGGWRAPWPIAARALAATVPVFAVGVWWTRYADAVKALNPAAEFLISSNLTDWNFGTFAQRTSAAFWSSVWQNLTANQLATPLALAAFPLLALRRSLWVPALVLLGTFLATILTFTNLYLLHDYYYYPIAAWPVAVAGLALAGLIDDARVPRPAAWLAVVVGLTLQFGAYHRGYFQVQRVDYPEGNGLTQAIRLLTKPDDVIMIYGDDWAAMVPYYSQRRALLIPGWREHNEESVARSIALLKDENVALLLFRGNSRGLNDKIDARRRDLGFSPDLAFRHVPSQFDVYVKQSDLMRISDQVINGGFHGIEPVFRPAGRGATWERNRLNPVTPALASYFAMMQPQPKFFAVPYDLTLYYSPEGRPRLSAHTPTDLVFAIPENATVAEGVFGVLEGAYKEGAIKGMAFEVVLRRSGVDDFIAHRAYLEPLYTPADRGPKQFRFEIPAEYRGHELIVRNRPGPSGDASFGWGFIEKIEIR